MADGVRIAVSDESVVSYLRRVEQRLSNMQPVFEDIGAVLEHKINLRFDRKVDPSGQAWAPLAPSTLAAYAKADRRPVRGGGTEVVRAGTLLERSRKMRKTLGVEATARQVEVGFAAVSGGKKPFPYPQAHEFGTSRMPRRGLLTADPTTGELGADDQRSVLDVLEDYLRE